MAYSMPVPMPANPTTQRVDGQLSAAYLASRFGSAPSTNTSPPSINSTTIAAGSNGVALPTGTVNVASTAGFAASGGFWVTIGGVQTYVTYTAVTGTSFTGCSGGVGTLATGQAVIGGDDGGGVQTVTNGEVTFICPTFADNYVAYWDPADVSNGGAATIYWMP